MSTVTQWQVDPRTTWLARWIPFVVGLLQDRGKILGGYPRFGCTRTVCELRDFANFAFRATFGMNGDGNTMEVYLVDRPISVLDVYWQDGDRPTVNFFYLESGWPKALDDAIARKNEILAAMDRSAAAQEEEKARRQQAQAMRALAKGSGQFGFV